MTPDELIMFLQKQQQTNKSFSAGSKSKVFSFNPNGNLTNPKVIQIPDSNAISEAFNGLVPGKPEIPGNYGTTLPPVISNVNQVPKSIAGKNLLDKKGNADKTFNIIGGVCIGGFIVIIAVNAYQKWKKRKAENKQLKG